MELAVTGWGETTLSDSRYFEYLNGLWKGKTPPFSQAIVVRNTNFRNDGLLDLSDAAILDVESRQLASRKLLSGDIIIERSGGGPKQPVGRVCYFNDAGPLPYSFSNFTTTLRVKDRREFSPRFLHYYLLHLYRAGFTEGLQRATTGIRNLDFTAYTGAMIPKPPKLEQEKIAALLWKVQKAVEVQDKLVRTARELKAAAMHQLFTCGLRSEPMKESEIGLVPESWTVLPLGDLGRIGNGSTPKRTTSAYWQNGTIPWLTSAKVYEGLIQEADEFVTESAKRECHLPLVPANSLVIAITGQGRTLGNSALVLLDTCVSQHLAYVQFTRRDVVPAYIHQFMSSRYEHLRQISQSGGSTKGALTCGFLKGYPVPLPGEDEQQEIASILQTLDRKISLHEKKRATLQDLFQTLLHQLMTARIRVHELDIDTSEIAG